MVLGRRASVGRCRRTGARSLIRIRWIRREPVVVDVVEPAPGRQSVIAARFESERRGPEPMSVGLEMFSPRRPPCVARPSSRCFRDRCLDARPRSCRGRQSRRRRGSNTLFGRSGSHKPDRRLRGLMAAPPLRRVAPRRPWGSVSPVSLSGRARPAAKGTVAIVDREKCGESRRLHRSPERIN